MFPRGAAEEGLEGIDLPYYHVVAVDFWNGGAGVAGGRKV